MIELGRREIYIHYGPGHGHLEARHRRRQKPVPRRNMNTVATLARMAAES